VAEPGCPSIGHGLLRVLRDVQGRIGQLQRWGRQWCQFTSCSGHGALAIVSLPASSLVAKECLAVADVLDSPSVDVLTSELQLSITFKVLHCLDMAGRSRSLSKEELDLVQFLVTQVASLSSSLACETSFAESSVPTPMAR
jgi:hypothetical protein